MLVAQIHVTDVDKVDALLHKHVGNRATQVLEPPFSAERFQEVGLDFGK